VKPNTVNLNYNNVDKIQYLDDDNNTDNGNINTFYYNINK